MRVHSISQFGSEPIGIEVWSVDGPTDADGNVVTISLLNVDANTWVTLDAAATHDGVGLYSYIIQPPLTQTKGRYQALWEYTMNGEARDFLYDFDIVDPQPYWDALSSDEKLVVDSVYFRISDGYDSTLGGPYLWELPQSNFRAQETISRIMTVPAMSYINFGAWPAFVPPYSVGAAGNPFPAAWYGLLEKATFVELVKHLRRSYVEQPMAVNVGTARLDRRDYLDRWGIILNDELKELDTMLKMLKRTFATGIKSRAMVLAGGIFPIAYLDPARPRWPYVATRI